MDISPRQDHLRRHLYGHLDRHRRSVCGDGAGNNPRPILDSADVSGVVKQTSKGTTLTLWIFLLVIAAAFVLTNFGWLLAMVGIYALLTQVLVGLLGGAALIVAGMVVWKLYRNHRQASRPRLIFKR